MTYHHIHPTLGVILITERVQCRRIIGRWTKGLVRISIPPNAPKKDVLDFIDKYAQRLAEIKRPAIFAIGRRMHYEEFDIEIATQNMHPGRILAKFEGNLLIVSVWHESDVTDPLMEASIGKLLMRVGCDTVKRRILPRVHQRAMELGLKPTAYKVLSGCKRMGKCTSRGEIYISGAVAFLPRHLQRFIIDHELAHLTHPNHSAAFHALANQYMEGNEERWNRECNAFVFPF